MQKQKHISGSIVQRCKAKGQHTSFHNHNETHELTGRMACSGGTGTPERTGMPIT